MTLVLCREVEFVNPYKFKERTKERGQAWEEVAGNLRNHGYVVTKRAVRDKYRAVKEGVQKKNSRELRESGIAPEPTDEEVELTQIVEDLQEVEKEMKEQQGEQQADEAKKKLDGVEMRQRALETFTETNKRINADEESPSRKRKKNTGGEAAKFLMQKLEMDREMKEREFQLRMEELQTKRQEDNQRREREERDEKRRREKEERDEERSRRDEAERERRFELLQQQIFQHNQLLMMMMKNDKQDKST